MPQMPGTGRPEARAALAEQGAQILFATWRRQTQVRTCHVLLFATLLLVTLLYAPTHALAKRGSPVCAQGTYVIPSLISGAPGSGAISIVAGSTPRAVTVEVDGACSEAPTKAILKGRKINA